MMLSHIKTTKNKIEEPTMVANKANKAKELRRNQAERRRPVSHIQTQRPKNKEGQNDMQSCGTTKGSRPKKALRLPP